MIDDYGEHMESLKSICEKNESLEKFKIVSSKLKGTDYFNFRWPQGESLLHWAASGGSDEICKYLLSLGSYVNAENIYGCNPIFYASTKEKYSIVKLLLKKGANFEAKSVFSGGTPLNPFNKLANEYKSEERLKIINLIKKYLIIKERSCNQSIKFKNLIEQNNKERDKWEYDFRKVETKYGNKTSQGYWGLPDVKAYKCFEKIRDNDEKCFYILDNSDKWCRVCCKTNKHDNINALRCSKCKKVYYCSIECQKTDYKVHKKICQNTI